MENIETIKMKFMASDPTGKLIPKGVTETMQVRVRKGVAIWWFRDSKTTRKFAEIEIKNPSKDSKTTYSQRLQKAATAYRGKTDKEIADYILNQMKKLNKNVR